MVANQQAEVGRRPPATISAQAIQRWQNELERHASHNLTMACRSILNRILDAAVNHHRQ